MNKIRMFFGLIMLALLIVNCEKDDICSEKVTTPRLVIEFYNNTDRTTLKSVTNLEITGVGLVDSLQVFNGVSKIMIPLRTTSDFSDFSLELFSTSTDPSIRNVDLIHLNYTREDVFVSRACGYKTIFTLDETNPVTFTDSATPGGTLWIKDITVEQPNINNEDETHINIYF